MKKLTLAQWANIAEIAASAILVLGLVYVGLGLDRNTKAIHSETWQAVIDKLIDLDVAEASTPELSRILILGESRFGGILASRLGARVASRIS